MNPMIRHMAVSIKSHEALIQTRGSLIACGESVAILTTVPCTIAYSLRTKEWVSVGADCNYRLTDSDDFLTKDIISARVFDTLLESEYNRPKKEVSIKDVVVFVICAAIFFAMGAVSTSLHSFDKSDLIRLEVLKSNGELQDVFKEAK